jgi:biopolymer transport protein TolR
MMQRKLLRRNTRDADLLPEISLTPLIDTALVLLVIFMVATPVMQNSIKVDLPKGQSQEAKGIAQDIVVHIAFSPEDKKETISLNGEVVKKEMIVLEIEKKTANKKDATVYVNGDSNAPYRAIAEIVDRIKYTAGVEHVVLGLDRA